MATKLRSKFLQNLTAPLPESLVHTSAPANRRYVFSKNCTNDHGSFAKGDKARGAFAPELVHSYLAAGILVPASDPEPEPEPQPPIDTSATSTE